MTEKGANGLGPFILMNGLRLLSGTGSAASVKRINCTISAAEQDDERKHPAGDVVRRKREISMSDGASPVKRDPILVIEDDLQTRRMIRIVLEREGLAVRTAANGREALPYLEMQRPSLVLLDLILPSIDPAVIAAIVRTAYGADIPLVVVSGAPHAAEKARAMGACAVIEKPFRLDDLVRLVRELLDGAP